MSCFTNLDCMYAPYWITVTLRCLSIRVKTIRPIKMAGLSDNSAFILRVKACFLQKRGEALNQS